MKKNFTLMAFLLMLLISAMSGIARANDADITFSTNTSATKFSIQNSLGVEVASITSNGDAYFHSYTAPSSAEGYQITADTSTLSIIFGSTSLGFPVGANENWTFEFNVQNSVVGGGTGTKWGINSTATASYFLAWVNGNNSTAANFTSAVLVTTGTLSAAFNSAAFANGWTRISGSILTTGAGNVTLGFAAGNAAQTTTVKAYSYVIARKTNN